VKHGLISEEMDLEEIARPPLFVPESTPAIRAAGDVQEQGDDVPIVVDEYGAVDG